MGREVLSALLSALGAARDFSQALAAEAFELYEQFRPDVPSGVRGWGAEGRLDTRRILALAR